jgi:predicted glycosyltransferase
MLNNTKINKATINKRVLIAPLDWGLGHTTRCIPIINELLLQGFEVIIAASGAGAVLLQTEFPTIEILPIVNYNITYSKTKKGLPLKLLLQLPKIIATKNEENKWLQKIIVTHKIDIVISDNRLGLFSKKAYCIFITHQLKMKAGIGFFDTVLQRFSYGFINKYNECWVPDAESTDNLSGELSHPLRMPDVPTKYIGILSRFKKTAKEKNIDLLVVLSGPEPQRSIFENILLQQTKELSLKMVLVRGLPNEDRKLLNNNSNLQILNHANAAALNDLLLASKIVLSRGGYTSVMDFCVLQQQAIFVPTAGQTEQEYLAHYLSAKKYCITMLQQGFNLEKALKEFEATKLVDYPASDTSLLSSAIKALQ